MWFLATIMAEKNEQEEVGAKPKGWYSDWVQSQETPYVMQRVRELGKSLFFNTKDSTQILGRKISKERGGTVDHELTGWFLRFLLERVRGRLGAEARAAYRARKAARGKLALGLERI